MNQNLESWTNLKRILAVRLDAMGDVLMTEPALRALKESIPGLSLSLLTSHSGSEAGKLLECVDEVLIYDSPWMKATRPREDSHEDRLFVDYLRASQFDAAVIFTVYSQNPLPSAMLCYWADIPQRLAHCRENPYQLLTHWVPDPEPQMKIRHEVRRQLDLVASVGCRTARENIQIRIPGEAKLKAHQKMNQAGVDPTRPFLVVHTGASAASRRYPPEKFAQMIQKLKLQLDFQIVLTGTEIEKPVIEFIRNEAGENCFSLAGHFPLDEFAAVLQSCALLISNNTGAVHVAAGVGTPVVDLYALTNPQHTPWGVENRVLFEDVACKYCYKSVCPEGNYLCLHSVKPERIVASVLELLETKKNLSEVPLYA